MEEKLPGLINNGKSYHPNVLVISGSGRKVGKTTLACNLIKRFSPGQPVAAIKISPHFHKIQENKLLYHEKGKYSVFRETDIHLMKDSSRMLLSGAAPVFYIQTREEHTWNAFMKCMEFLEGMGPVICESGGVSRFMRPGLGFYLTDFNGMSGSNGKPSGFIEIRKDSTPLNELINTIEYSDGLWKRNN